MESIQAVLRRRRGATFVGRGDELTRFRANFGWSADDERRAFIFTVHGEGGVGKSTLLERWRQFTEARPDLDQAVRPNPESGWVISIRGAVLRNLERHDEALTDLTRAIELDPGAATHVVGRAMAERELGRTEQASADLTRAATLDPTLTWPYGDRQLHTSADR
ncbi:tetratricopeptide repeat protein [Actinoplanes sp. LDG1-06]|uniref:Tetratricopeptide repeat protein n=1 Tax=Paractinoplanes ovalisporus TaxID=2810368 RepID=A0ABS2AJP6_9ACTN|nr:tetratricopeptide repeat protein [Actinoplanes ovalisporus]MBM2620020.1 tetratricopeptide repeat protein [Actinoplanes ovalisporus]